MVLFGYMDLSQKEGLIKTPHIERQKSFHAPSLTLSLINQNVKINQAGE